MTASNRSTSESKAARFEGASIHSLERSIDRFSLWLHFCATVVVIGVILEYVPQFYRFWKTPTVPVFKDMVGGVLVAVGVAGELLFGFLAGHKDNQLRALNASRLAELNLLAEQEQLARVKLEAQIATMNTPRRISHEAREMFKSRLTRFAGQKFHISQAGQGDNEARDFAEELATTLKECGWDGTIHTGFGTLAGDPPYGLAIEMDQIAVKTELEVEALMQLFGVLHTMNICIFDNPSIRTVNQHNPNSLPPTGGVRIFVGQKPPPNFSAKIAQNAPTIRKV